MTSLGVIDSNNQANGFVELFGYANPVTGSSKTAVATVTGGDVNLMIGNTISYSGVISVGDAVTNYGAASPESIQVSSAAGHVVVGAFGCGVQLTAGDTSRYLNNLMGNSGCDNLLIEETAGAATAQLDATGNDWWGAVAIDLIGEEVPAVTRLGKGAGNRVTSGACSWNSFNIVSSDANTYTVVLINVSDNATTTTLAPTYGGQAMTELGIAHTASGYATVGIYFLKNPPTGVQTVTFTPGGASTKYAYAGIDLAFSGVDHIGDFVTRLATGHAFPSVSYGYSARVLSNGASLSAPNETDEYGAGSSVTGVGDYIRVQSGAGATPSKSFTCSGTATTPISAGVTLYPAQSTAKPWVVASTAAAISGQNAAVTFGNNYVPAENDVIVMFSSSTTTATPTAPSGWVNPLGGSVDVESDQHEIACIYHLVTAAEAAAVTRTYTATTLYDASETGAVLACAVRNVDPANVIDSTGTWYDTANTATPHYLPGLTGANLSNDSLVISSVAADSTGSTYSVDGAAGVPTGWTFWQWLNTNQSRALLVRDALTVVNSDIANVSITPLAGDEGASITLALTAKPGAVDYTKDFTDALGLTDPYSKGPVATDALGLTDAATKAAGRTFTDAEALTDALTRVMAAVRAVTDPLGATDALTRVMAAVRSATDTLGLTDAATAVAGYPRTAADALGGTDSLTRVMAAVRSATDTLGITDALTASLGYPRTATDLLGLADDATAVLSQVVSKTATDALGLTDALTAVQVFSRSAIDALGLTDALTASLGYPRTVTDALGLTDDATAVLTGQQMSATPTDQLGLADTSTVAQDFFRPDTDGLGLTDSAAAVQDFSRSLTDALVATDALTAVIDAVRVYTETLGGTDSIVLAADRRAADALGLTDAPTRVMEAARAAADVLGLTDAPTLVLGRTATDTLGLTDAATRTADAVRDATDTLGLADSATADLAGSGEVVKSDALGLADTLTRVATAYRATTDSLGLTDAIGVGPARTATDALGLTDSRTTLFGYGRPVTDALGLTDAYALAVGRTTVDALGSTDNVTAVLSAAVSATDPLGLADTATRVAAAVRAATDPLGLADSATFDLAGVGEATKTDALGLTDALTTKQGFARSVTDPLGGTDAAAVARDYRRTVTDHLGATDALAKARGYFRTATDALGLTDSAEAIRVEPHTEATDTLELTDQCVTELVRGTPTIDLRHAIVVCRSRSNIVLKPRRDPAAMMPGRTAGLRVPRRATPSGWR